MKKLLTLALLSISVSAYAADIPQKPDPVLTPGVVNPAATKAVVCVPNYTSGTDAQGKKVRNVPESVKKQVFAEYKIDPKSDKFEIDHLISLELGGANDVKNLWPQSYTSSPYNAHLKDALENKLHKMICSGQIDMATAQKEISTDWIAAYNKYVKN
jgi:hypothetical protein